MAERALMVTATTTVLVLGCSPDTTAKNSGSLLPAQVNLLNQYNDENLEKKFKLE
jgi:hypothetical protein